MGSAWKQLPDELPEPARRLAEELRAVKDAAGLSLSELAARTHYSRASWERWLNGKRVVTEQALDALAGAVECDGAALRALWRRAVAGPEAVADGPSGAEEPAVEEPAVAEPAAEEAVREPVSVEEAPVAGPAPAVWWRRPAALVSGAAALALLLVLVGLRISRHDGQAAAADRPAATTGASAAPKPGPTAPACQAVGCAHKDPKTTGCGKDARTLQTQVVGKVVVYLRYSQTCRAAWAAITEGQPKDYATITDGTGESETALIHWGYDNYSAMLDAADPTVTFQVCGYQPAGHDCTAVVSDLAMVVASTPIPIGPASPPPGTGAGASTTPAPATPADPAPTDPSAPAAAPSPS
ncbi:XRE family transcriptional regulator [Kitasatospora xanthocidica]|uniref:helix-turn-helix domain-containing protein n=1 Tax=Kitasatospora xanthocidica TaxID=83382 RepID=UPI0011C3CEC2|nr:XRE family transcriptional regulator [Kitasatospora xanthocidica]